MLNINRIFNIFIKPEIVDFDSPCVNFCHAKPGTILFGGPAKKMPSVNPIASYLVNWCEVWRINSAQKSFSACSNKIVAIGTPVKSYLVGLGGIRVGRGVDAGRVVEIEGMGVAVVEFAETVDMLAAVGLMVGA